MKLDFCWKRWLWGLSWGAMGDLPENYFALNFGPLCLFWHWDSNDERQMIALLKRE